MSAKSSGHTEVHTHGLVSRKTLIVAVLVVVGIFFTIISYYPLIFSSESTGQNAPKTEVK
ncbi:MAG: hypothetical protein H7Z71_02885 [Moraxellaceae bacterium]|nr:hypothetical protein [Pseudobdellovibrionaceae bacterium]